MTNSAVFNDIELFGIIPSSNCNVNEDLYSFMDQIRCLKGIQPVKRKYPEEYTNTQKNLLLRHTQKNPHISAIHLKNVQIWVEMKSFLQFVLIQIIKRGLIS